MMRFRAGPAGSPSLGLQGASPALYSVLVMSVLFGPACVAQGPAQPPALPRLLRCYRCLLETRELGCLLGSDVCLTSADSSCITLHIRNNSGADVMVSGCRSKEHMVDCTHTRPSPVFGFWIFSRCCFLDLCNDPENRQAYVT